jgi:AcrR family transcriptional regulator
MPNPTVRRRKAAADPARTAPKPNARNRPQEEQPISDRRAQVLKSSARLFAEFGFETTSMRQIADEVNLLPGSIYHHFATKEDILHAILKEPLHRFAQDIVSISQLPVDAEHRLIASALMRFYRYMREWEVHAIILHDSKFFRRTRDFSYVQDAKLRAFHVLESILQDGVRTRLFHADIDTYLMIGTTARMLISTANWFRVGDMYSSDRPTKYTVDHVIDYQLDCMLRMIRTPSRLSEPIPREACERLTLFQTG